MDRQEFAASNCPTLLWYIETQKRYLHFEITPNETIFIPIYICILRRLQNVSTKAYYICYASFLRTIYLFCPLRAVSVPLAPPKAEVGEGEKGGEVLQENA